MLSGIEESVKIILGNPPDPVKSDSSFIGYTKRFEGLENQLIGLHHVIVYVVEKVLGTPPDPIHGYPLLPSFYDIRDVSQNIVDFIGQGSVDRLSDQDALLALQRAARNLSDQAQGYIDIIEISAECEPGPTSDQRTCGAAPNCVWINYGPTGPYCCCVSE